MKRLGGTKAEKDQAREVISEQIDVMHGAFNALDFNSRCGAIRNQWGADGLAEKTTWTDKQGNQYNYVTSFFKQWQEAVPEWYLGAAGDDVFAPCTNNAAESTIKNIRNDARNLVAPIGEVLQFLLAQVKHVSMNAFAPDDTRRIPSSLWQRAFLFSGLFKTDKIQLTRRQERTLYVCKPRLDPEADNVCNRALISKKEAESITTDFVAQLQGDETTVEKLQGFSGPCGLRVFGFHGNIAMCTCPAFPPARRCFHTLG